METIVIAKKGEKSIRFTTDENKTSIEGKNTTINEIQNLMDNEVHNGAEYDGWNVNFD
jgi:hypothetical protein